MGMRMTNLSEVVMMLQLADRNVNRETREAMKKAAELIRDTAKHYAPVDEFNLVKAIHILPSQGNQYSLRITIAVSGTVGGRIVDEYATIVHEYPWHKRGPLTRMKGPQAGPRYLSRAMEDTKKEVMATVAKAMQEGIDRAVLVSGVNKPKKKKRR